MLRKIARGLGWVLLTVIALAVLGLGALFAVNWNDRPPNSSSRHFDSIISARQTVPDKDNGYVFLMGYDAPPDGNPTSLGRSRIGTVQGSAATENSATDTLPAVLQSALDACKPAAGACASHLAEHATAIAQSLSANEWRLDRYRALQSHSGWYEWISTDTAYALPFYSQPMRDQRLLLMHAWLLANAGNHRSALTVLETDAHFWRKNLADTHMLIGKMIATAALRQHFEFGNLVLRQIAAKGGTQIAPASWHQPFGTDELSLRATMAGEWLIVSTAIEQALSGSGSPGSTLEDTSTMPGAPTFLRHKLVHVQDTKNRYADMLQEVAELSEKPHRELLAGVTAKNSAPAPGTLSVVRHYFYNPVGKILLRVAAFAMTDYPIRVANLEAIRRAALATATLRAADQPLDTAPAQLAAMSLRNPYSDAPFGWSASSGEVIFFSPGPAANGRHAFLY